MATLNSFAVPPLLCFALSVMFMLASAAGDDDVLRLLIQLSVNGARSPKRTSQEFMTANVTWHEGPDQLTAIGERQHWVLGTLNRVNYLRTLVPRSYDAEQTYFYAIPTESARQSLAAMQLGMYPLYTGPILSPD